MYGKILNLNYKFVSSNFVLIIRQLLMNSMNSFSKKCNYRFCRIFLRSMFLYGDMLYIITLSNYLKKIDWNKLYLFLCMNFKINYGNINDGHVRNI